MKKNYSINSQIALSILFIFAFNFSVFAQSINERHSTYVPYFKTVNAKSVARISSSTPTTLSTTTVTACGSYTWAENGQTYTSTGIYTSGGGITQLFNDQTAWSNSATATGATVDFNDLSGIAAAATVTVPIGSTTVSLTAPSGIYSDGTFLGTNFANESITITFSPAVYGVSGNFFDTDVSDTVISGNVTATYSDGAVDSRTVTTDTETFGYFSTTPITSLTLSTTTTTPNRFISLRNLSVATNPASGEVLDLTITPIVTPTFPIVAPVCAGSPLSALTTTSDNGITGTWSPALDNSTTTTYTFTPDIGQCAATKDVTITVFPITSYSTDLAACTSYTWPVNGMTYTSSGIYMGSVPLVDTVVIDDFSLWYDHAASYNSTINFDNLGNIVATNPTVIPMGAVTVSMSAPGGMYNGLDFLGTVNANAPLTITFNPPVYGVAANYFTTDINDNVIPGNVTVTYSNGSVESRTVSTDTDDFGYFDNNFISTIILTSSTADRYISLKNLLIAADPHSCSSETLNLTINNGPVPGDTMATAIEVNTPNYATTGNNLAANCYTDTYGELSPDVWYKVNLDACAQSLSLNTCTGSNFDTIIRVITQDGTTELASSDDDCGSTFQSYLSGVDVSTQDVVYVLVEGYYGLNNEQGNYGLEITQTLASQTTPTFTAIAPICNGDTFTLPTTSNNGITGTWSPAIDNTTTTSYLFTPDAGQCATNTSLTVTVNQSTTVPTFNAVANICNGDSLAALPTTSNNGILGTWSPALDNTATTTYTFTPNVGQCATTASLTINVNQPTTPSFTSVADICNGDSLAALPTTSNNGILGTWSPALDNTATTTYIFTPNVGQCATTASLTINVNQPTTPSFTSVADICNGDSLAALPTTSNNGILGTWSPALDNTATTTYSFAPNSGQCATSASLTITVNSAGDPTGNTVQNFAVSDPNNATIATIVINPAAVIWYASLTDAQTETNPLPSSTTLTNGATYYAVNVVGSCSSEPFAVTVNVTLGNDEFDNLHFTYYPNPTSSVVNISYSKNITQLTIVNMLGQVIMTEKTNSMEVQLDLSRLAEAAYFVKVIADENEKVIKVIKRK